MNTRAERTRKIEKLEQLFGSAIGVYLTDINRIDVARMTQLRGAMGQEGLEYVVVKNTLARIALERAGRTDIVPFLQGQTGIAFAKDEGTAPARVIKEFRKGNKGLLDVRAAYVEGTLLPGDAWERLADIPPREVLLSQLASTLKAPMQNVASVLNNILGTFVGALRAVQAKREGEQGQGA
jgi:large subunit ribosomal protein L10